MEYGTRKKESLFGSVDMVALLLYLLLVAVGVTAVLLYSRLRGLRIAKISSLFRTTISSSLCGWVYRSLWVLL